MEAKNDFEMENVRYHRDNKIVTTKYAPEPNYHKLNEFRKIY